MLASLTCLFLLLCTCGPALCLAQEETSVSSTIQHVTVYRAGAQVQRAGEVDLPAGRSTLVFGGLASSLDPASVQASTVAEGDGRFTMYGLCGSSLQ